MDPGPPTEIAAATPTIFPVPMWLAAEIVKALKGEIAFSSLGFAVIRFLAWPIFVICPAFILKVK